MALVWLAIGLGRYRDERIKACLIAKAIEEPDPAQWVEMPRSAVTDPLAPRWGMTFTPSRLPLDRVLHGGPGKDGVPALTQPRYVAAEQAACLKPETRVIGVALGGQARAWPLSILQYHEVVNDTLAGRPLLVTHNPFCDTAMVFSREIDGTVRDFGTSGLFYESAPLIYDRQPGPGDESLWSPLMMRAVCGPAVADGLRLELIDAELMTWRGWVERHPETSVLATETGYAKPYHFSGESRYLLNDYLMMPVENQTDRRPDLRNKDRVLVVAVGRAMKAYPLADLKAQKDGRLLDEVGGQGVALEWDEASGGVNVRMAQGASGPLRRAYCYWFAWDAHYPVGAVYGAVGGGSVARPVRIN